MVINMSEERKVAAFAAADENIEEDPKQYTEAPFKYAHTDNESVSLNSGALIYTVTDFVIPGKNGMDTVIRRKYNSAQANTHDVSVNLAEKGRNLGFVVIVKYKIKGDTNWYTHEDYSDSGYADNSSVTAAAEKRKQDAEDFYVIGYDYSEFGGTLSSVSVSYTIQDYGYREVYQTETRPNDHDLTTYYLGYGWSLGFSSIESVAENYRLPVSGSFRMKYNDFLHLGDGRTYKINLNKSSGLEDYELEDIKLEKKNGTSPVDYNYIISYKDGSKEYLQIVNSSISQRSRLAAQQDRFGNIIKYSFPDSGGIIIIDSLNQEIRLKKEGSLLKWSLPLNKEISYAVSGNQLVKVVDEIGQETNYNYASQSAYCRPMYDYGQDGVDIPYFSLTSIKHHTGATTEFSYAAATSKAPNGTMGHMHLRSRKNISGANNITQSESYSYKFSGESEDYIKTAILINSDGLTTTCTFDKDGLLKGEEKVLGSKILSSKGFDYSKKLLIKETIAIPLPHSIYYTYDNKGNVTSHTDPLGNKTNITYHNHSIPNTKTWYKDKNTKLEEINALSVDGKSIASTEIKENGVRKQLTKFIYSPAGSGALYRIQECDTNGLVQRETQLIYQDSKDVFVRQKIVGGKAQDTLVYNIYGNIISKTDANTAKPRVTSYNYDQLGRLKKEINPDGTYTENSYKVSTAENSITTYEKDEKGAVLRSKKTLYTPLGQVEKTYILSPDTLLSQCEYDEKNRLKTETNLQHGTTITSYTYDSFDRIKTKTVAGKNVDHTEIYDYNDAFNTTQKLSLESKQVVGETGAPTVSSCVIKDILGRPVKEIAGNTTGSEASPAAVTSYEYDIVGNKVKQIDANKNSFSWTYDYAGRVVSETKPTASGTATAYTGYDTFGRKLHSKDFRQNTTSYKYDVLDRLLQQKSDLQDSAKLITEYDYDEVGNVTKQRTLCDGSESSPIWRETGYIYDDRYRVKDTITNDGKAENRTRFVYDKLGNKTAQYVGMTGDSISGAQQTTYSYDRYGNVTRITDPTGKIEQYSYNSYGVLTQKQDRNGFVTSFVYDGLGRVVKETVADSNGKQTTLSKSFSYYKNGMKAHEENETLRVVFEYNNLGRMIKQAETCKNGAANGIIKSYGYDTAGNRESFVMTKDGKTEISLTYKYSAPNMLANVLKNGTVIAGYEYDQNGNRVKLSYPQSGMATTYEYNAANLIKNMRNTKGSADRSSYQYTYYPDGNQASKASNVAGKKPNNTAYTYDRMGRLIQEKDNNGTTVYNYDRFGNRSKMISTDINGKITTTDYIYDQRNRLETETKKYDKTTEIFHYSYDFNGNQIQREWEKLSPAGEEKYTDPGRIAFYSDKFGESVVLLERRQYNGYNQLVKLYRDTLVTEYQYRPDGLRHKKLYANGTAISHIWDGQNIVAEYGTNGVVHSRYLRGVNLIACDRDNLMQYYLFNAHGDVVERTDQNGTTLKNYDYDAFGVEQNPETLDTNPFRYCGEYFDREADTLYLRARNYSAANGRFDGEDPVRDGLNWYGYCGGNPVRFVDPSGLTPWAQLAKERNPSSNFATSTRYTYLNDSSSSSNSAKSKNTKFFAYTSVYPSNNELLTEPQNPPEMGDYFAWGLYDLAYKLNKLNKSILEAEAKTTAYIAIIIYEATSSKKKDEEKDDTADKGKNDAKTPDYPGDDPTKPPGDGWEWRGPDEPGGDKGAWYNPKTGQSLKPDLNHPEPMPPHWDYVPYKNGPQYRYFPDGTLELK